MTKKPFFLVKALISTLCFFLIISIGFNIYQYRKLVFERNSNINMSRHYMSEHEVTFNNVFSSAGSTDILEYIKNTDNLNGIIEGIQIAASNYLAASKFDTKNPSTIQSRTLIIGYLSELRSYRSYLQSNSNNSYQDINQIKIAMNDLQTISNWLEEKFLNSDFEVYTDKDFFNEVYKDLNNQYKADYFIIN